MKYSVHNIIFLLVESWSCFFGDLYQLPPVQAKRMFMFNEIETSEEFLMLDLGHKFKLAELTEKMCQKGDTMFI